jgi:hypothetical protein
MVREVETNARRQPSWPDLLVGGCPTWRSRLLGELLLALLAAVGALLGMLFAAGVLVYASAPPPILRPAEGLALLARVAVTIPLPILLGGRLGIRLGQHLLRRARFGLVH